MLPAAALPTPRGAARRHGSAVHGSHPGARRGGHPRAHVGVAWPEQTRRPDRVVVVADNCTDATVEVAVAHGVEVVETVGNTEKKAGALNQQLARLLPHAEHRDVVMVMDADSTLAPEFLEVALGLMEDDPDLVAVGGLFYGEDGGRLVGQFQRNEYTRYQRLVARKLGRVFVLTGTASVIRAYALRAVAEARGPLLPGPAGQGLRHARADRGQRAHPGVEDPGSADDVAARVSRDDRDHDVLARPVATAAAVAPRRAGEHRRLRPDPGHRDVLGPAARPGLRRGRAPVLPVADDGEPAGRRQHPLVAVLDDDRADLRGGADRHGLAASGGGAARSPRRSSSSSGTSRSCRPASSPRFVQILLGRKAGWNYVPRPATPGAVPARSGGAGLITSWGVLLPASVLDSDWYAALALWVGFNTLVFAFLSLLHLLPPLHRRTRPQPTVATVAAGHDVAKP